MLYPIAYEADYLRERNRLTTFFRLIVAIPWIIVASIIQLAALVVVVIAWFAIIILGRFPAGMYNFVGGALRMNMRVNGFVYLQTDAWPAFGLSDDPAYPIRVRYADPAARQSRLKTLFRVILLFPVMVLSYLMSYVLMMIAGISWLTIVFRGYQPAAIHNALSYVLGWETRVAGYAALMRDEYPPVGDEVEVDVDPPAEQPALPGYGDPATGLPESRPSTPAAPEAAPPKPGSPEAAPPKPDQPGERPEGGSPPASPPPS